MEDLRRWVAEAFEQQPRLAGTIVDPEAGAPPVGLTIEVTGAGGRRLCLLDGTEDLEPPTLGALFELSHRQRELGATRSALLSRVGFSADVMSAAGSLGVDLLVFERPARSERRAGAGPHERPSFYRVTGATRLAGIELSQWLSEASRAPLAQGRELVS